ncbi:hypothetical protein Tsubulata_039811 [Turnera subulata]|uniref:Receptor-like serine/threonine-protein kinase n=1 Tax=Turnera subulata TaxID=218843 RepID=A0A9Q0J149_9ROSI|nr:hypothetical protein Tsubulata_039811 [Turnera subulata]
MDHIGFLLFVGSVSLFLLLLLPESCKASPQATGRIEPGFQGSSMSFIDSDGLFLFSNSSNFSFGFKTTQDVTLFLLVVVHLSSSRVIWSANRRSPVANSDTFIFSEDGKVSLQRNGGVVWTADTGGRAVSAIELLDSGNLVLLGNDSSSVVWQSFSHPADTLISSQDFVEGMKLVSDPSPTSLTYSLEIKSGDMILSAGFKAPQPYWSIRQENRKTINKDGDKATLASLDANSWKFFDRNKVLLWQFIFSYTNNNATWVAVLGNDGFVSFYNLDNGQSSGPSPTKIPSGHCSRPESCDAYSICSSDNNFCVCPSALSARPNCKTGIVSACDASNDATELVDAGHQLNYFALGFVPPYSKTDLEGCKASCRNNCSCIALFFQNSSGDCFLFSEVGSFQNSAAGSGFDTYIKILSNGGSSANSAGDGNSKGFPVVVIVVVVATLPVIIGLCYLAFRCYKRKERLQESLYDSSGDGNFLDSLSGMPVRFSYKDLQTATNNFSVKLGQGGFGSVYQGVLPDGTRLAVKKLEGIGQGQKEFQAEVSIIGSIHHHHLVRLKGFCAEGTHRLLAYEFMANGSLDKWIFKKDNEFMLDWETRLSIALGTAKGLAYFHEECNVKIIHCDIKPENVLIDDSFIAKVSDFGLAKLMTREQSHVFTTLRGTRGYLAPEWITNNAISEKSDVYSYGMLLLEIIGGRRNYDPAETSEKSNFPSFALKMMQEGKVREILDSRLMYDEADERVSTAIKVALWCIQHDMYLRPAMTKVVQMLEGLCHVSRPPASSPLGSPLFPNFFKSISEGSEAFLSAVRLSGPR